jgi:tRNA-uridine 2-sulfurtransferase
MKAIMLLSGGLDSILAARVVIDQGIELEAVNFLTVFCNCTNKGESCLAAQKAVEALKIPLRVFQVTEEIIDVVRRPKHGYGSHLNPCLDCRILMFRKAKAFMEASNASFLVTGEVLGERPMSQRRDAMALIEREAGLDGKILRPLSARLMPPTIPETEGWVDREKLLAIQGRSRKPQIGLAQSLGIRDYPCPAGGCLLTDPQFAKRMKDLMVHQPDFSINDVHLLKAGRHFRLGVGVKLIVGRDEEDNRKIKTFGREGDLFLKMGFGPGPVALLRGPAEAEELILAARLTARYGREKSGIVPVLINRPDDAGERELSVSPSTEEEVTRWML